MINSCAFSFLSFKFSSVTLYLLHQYLSLLHLCLSVCLSVCLPVCLSVSLFLSISLYLSISLTSDNLFFFSFSICLFRSIIQYFYLTHWYNFFLSFLVRPLQISPSLSVCLSRALSLSVSLFLSLSLSFSVSFSLFCLPLLYFLNIVFFKSLLSHFNQYIN